MSATLSNEKKLAILNSMQIIDDDCRHGEVVYVHVAYNTVNFDKLSKVVPDINKYLDDYGDPDGEMDHIDISVAAFEYAGADIYENGQFYILSKDDLMKRYFDEQRRRIKLERELKRLAVVIQHDIQRSLDRVDSTRALRRVDNDI